MVKSMNDLGDFLVCLEDISVPFLATHVDYLKLKRDQKMAEVKNLCVNKYCIVRVEGILPNNV